LQELGAGFVAAAFAAGEGGFGGDEAAFDGGFEHGGLVALEIGLDALEAGDGFVKTRELLFDFGDDAALFIKRGKRKRQRLKIAATQVVDVDTKRLLANLLPVRRRLKKGCQIARFDIRLRTYARAECPKRSFPSRVQNG